MLRQRELVAARGNGVPTDAHRECPLGPVPALDEGHLAFGEGTGPVEGFVRVAVFGGVEAVGVGADPVVGVRHCQLTGRKACPGMDQKGWSRKRKRSMQW